MEHKRLALPVRLTEAGLPHAPVLSALMIDSFGAEAWSEASLTQLLATPGMIALLAVTGPEASPEPVGFVLARVAADEAELLSIGVLRSMRGQGNGRALLDGILQAVSQAGAASVFLEVGADNPAAQALYTAAGFETIATRKGYYNRLGGTAVDAEVMQYRPESQILR